MTAFAAAIALLLAMGCGASEPANSKTHGGQVENLTGATGLARVLAATDINGVAVSATNANNEATVIVFFASWCEPCRHELAVLGELRLVQPKLRIIGVNAYEEWGELSDEQRLRTYLANNAPWLQVVRDTGDMRKAFGGVPKIPTLFVYDGNGQLSHSFRRNERRPPTKLELEAAIATALGG